MIHYQFETIHPFLDAGRRAYCPSLNSAGLSPCSNAYFERRSDYYDRLQAVRGAK